MKKFLIAAVSFILISFIWYKAYYQYGFFVDMGKAEQVKAFTSVEGKAILVDEGDGLKPFEIRGVDLGAGIPGHFSTEYAIDKETYLRWFGLIQEMGANTIRVYTILSSDFYDAVYEYNMGNPDPLYVLHGVWVNDYVQNSHVDAYDRTFFDVFLKDCRTMVDVVHGRRRGSLSYAGTGASGFYTKDISPWVLGYILGVEWEDVTVAYTDHMKEGRNSYSGRYLYTSEDATPFEALLAEAGDRVIDYESRKYGQQRLLAFSNWPTTDPLDYPESLSRQFMKCAKIDVEHIRQTEHFRSGQFASYHIYSYYPDYLLFYDSWKSDLPYADKYRLANGDYNTYGVYLEMINRHHTLPVVISEFGVPASRGRAQVDYHTSRSQGFMSEKEQGEALVSSYRDIMGAGCAGCVIFSWQDEWFKRTWNTMANVDLQYTAWWSDFQTNEQFFGLLSFDPGAERSVCYTDGDMEEWEGDAPVAENGGLKLYCKYDEKFLYFRVHGDGMDLGSEKIYIPVDVTPKSGSYYAQEQKLRFSNAADFLIILDGEDESRVLVQERYNAFNVIFAEDFSEPNPYQFPPEPDSPVFEPIYMALQMANFNALKDEFMHPEKHETGKLTYGNGNPGSPSYHSVSDFIINGPDIELRIPWQLLNFSNPARMVVHDDYFEHYGIEGISVDGIYAGLGGEEESGRRIPMEWIGLEGWGSHPTSHERLKKSYYAMKEIWAEGGG